MKWTSHKVLTGSFIFLCTGNFLSATVALVGSVFPDLVEGVPSNSTSYRKRHRQFSHWFVPYLVFVIFTFILGIKLNSLFVDPEIVIAYLFNDYKLSYLSYIGFYFFLGSILHVVQDSFCGTVPSFNLKKRFGVSFFKVGSIEEYLIVFILAMLLIIASKILYF